MVTFHTGKFEVFRAYNEIFEFIIYTDNISRILSKRKYNNNIPSFFILRSDRNVEIKTLNSFNELIKNSGNHMMPIFFEDGMYDFILKINCDYKYLDIYQNNVSIRDKFNNYDGIEFGRLEFNSDVGYTNIKFLVDYKELFNLTLEVFPSKIDYRRDYHIMITEINEEIASMAFKLIDKTYLEAKLSDTKNQTGTEFINILNIIFDDFIKKIEFLVKNLKHNIISEEVVSPSYKAKKVSRKTIDYIKSRGDQLRESREGCLSIDNRKYEPLFVIENKKRTTVDIFENQMVKFLIKDIIKKIEQLIMKLKFINNDYFLEIDKIFSLKKKVRLLKGILYKDFRNISDIIPKNSMSLVFKMADGYKDFYKKYIILLRGLSLGEDIFKITPKKIYELYEIWCYIKIHQILFKMGYNVKDYGILTYNDDGISLNLRRENESVMVYEKEDKKLMLHYNKSYSLPTTNQRPDTVLCIENIGERRMYIFDAKYRVRVDANGNESPMEEDINIMHRYRDSIVSKSDRSFKYKHETFGAYVMFPCVDEKKYKNNKFFKSIEEVNIGAFPMLPGSTSLIEKHLIDITNKSNLEAKEDRNILDNYDDFARFRLDNVMVVNVKDRKHLEAYLSSKFYHVPRSQLSTVKIGIKYIAFYQPMTQFNKEESGIFYYGEIERIKKYKRNKCLEIPSSKEDIYLRINLKDIKRIDRIKPIQSGPRILMYTTLYLLQNAKNMHELKISSPLEIKAYKKLKIYAEDRNISIFKKDNIYKLGDNSVEVYYNYIKVNGKKAPISNIIKELK